MLEHMQDITTDVLIVGSGCAGLFAAKSCQGVKTTLITKNNFLSSNSFYSPWNMRVGSNEELDFQKIKEAGLGLNDDKLLRIYAKGIASYTAEFDELSIKLRKTAIGCAPPGNKYPGKAVLEKLLARLKDRVELLPGSELVALVKSNNAVTGALIKSGSGYLSINAKAVIMACGGVGGMFQNTTNMPADDGGALGAALRAGAMFVNPEFQMFHPFLIKDSKVPNVLFSGEMLSKLNMVNKDGVEFLSADIRDAIRRYDYHHIFPQMLKDIYDESRRGKIYLDFGNFRESEFERLKVENEYGWLLNYIKIGQLVEFAPAEHYFVGGLKINEKCETNLRGFYACGECAGGLHGANRIGGNGIPEGIIFGRIAGLNASMYAKSTATCKNADATANETMGYDKILKLRKIMWDNCGIERDDNSLKNAASELNELGSFNQTLLARLIVHSSMVRRYSVGVFRRSDFPQTPEIKENNYIDIRGLVDA